MQHHATQQEEAAECCGHCVFEHDRLISILRRLPVRLCQVQKLWLYAKTPRHSRTMQDQTTISTMNFKFHCYILAASCNFSPWCPCHSARTWRMKPKLRMHDTAGSLLQSREQACLQPHVKITRCYKFILQHACCTYLSIFGKP